MASCVVISGCSAGMEVGIDAYSWVVGPRFGGVRDVEPGLHLVVMSRGDGVGRQGVWIELGAGEVVAKEWDATAEGIAHEGANPSLGEGSVLAMQREAATPGALKLGGYPPDHAGVWRALSRHVTRASLRRCGLELDASFSCDETPVDDEEEEFDGTCSRPSPTWTEFGSASSTGEAAAVTRSHLDGSERVRRLVRTTFGAPTELLAEIELAFVCFLALGSLAALKQWQKGLALVASCDDLMAAESAFFQDLVDVLRAQLSLAPPNFFRDPIGRSEDFLRPALANLLEGLADDRGLFDFVRDRFGLFADAADRDDARRRRLFDAARSAEDAPVVVVDGSPGAMQEDDDPRAVLRRLGFVDLATEMDPEREDPAMAAMRVLDEGPPSARADAFRYLESLAGEGASPASNIIPQ
ncbi:hypothetical protein CTAYLR_002870 [Chrysophaeum taylorii]|uniref:Uncharacterized protein n=1 Tax=Chrysophaeum taylorii TaxID=2483200 RepID=A0AAD7XIT6_9STRA|nr:hypothetical protein CTAYLR_002870 [Chrysophaeum taylorii]